jgi:hypothetical protein
MSLKLDVRQLFPVLNTSSQDTPRKFAVGFRRSKRAKTAMQSFVNARKPGIALAKVATVHPLTLNLVKYCKKEAYGRSGRQFYLGF